ncbi:MAG: N-acetyltransferase [Spirochaetales bacterium]|nr:N-acetyltransferase [Spirochaetales bacterium]
MEGLIIRKPTVNDVPQILELINGYANAQMMLNKSHYRIYTTLQNFIVAEYDNKICGCCALNILWSDLGEICSLAVAEDFLKQGIGSALVKACIEEAKKYKLPRLITLTYQDKFFEKMGFVFSDKNAFPRKLWRECLECPKLEHCDELAYVLELPYE